MPADETTQHPASTWLLTHNGIFAILWPTKRKFLSFILLSLITVPPLRDRIEDIPLLVNRFVEFFSRKMGKPALTAEIPKRSMQELQAYSWPGNARELMHVVEGALISAHGKKLNFVLPKYADDAINNFKSLEEMDRQYILDVLKAKNWKIGGKNNSAASTLGMNVNTLRGRMKKLGIQKPAPR